MSRCDGGPVFSSTSLGAETRGTLRPPRTRHRDVITVRVRDDDAGYVVRLRPGRRSRDTSRRPMRGPLSIASRFVRKQVRDDRATGTTSGSPIGLGVLMPDGRLGGICEVGSLWPSGLQTSVMAAR